MAIAAKLVRDMPADHGWMVAVPLRKLPVDRMDLLPIDRRSITVVMPEAVQVTDPSRLRATSGYFSDIQAGLAPLGVAKRHKFHWRQSGPIRRQANQT